MSKADTNCNNSNIDEFPNLLTDAPTRLDFIAIAVVVVMYTFAGIAIVCDGYFVPALEYVSAKFKMRDDIAGATIMAGATSSPEFFISLIGTFVTEGDIGIGTILGSSIFNLLVITACCALFAGMKVILDWWSLTRDICWYVASVVALTLILINKTVYWYESVLLVVMYAIYLVNLVFDSNIQKLFRDPESPGCLSCFPADNSVMEEQEEVRSEGPNMFLSPTQYPHDSRWLLKMYWIFTWPILVMFFITIPNCRRKSAKKFFVLSMIMCIVWISVSSYIAAWMITVLGYNLYVPDSLMGLTLLAMGISVPEVITSVIISRKGHGSMAISSAISSNTIDILIGLSIPWLSRHIYLTQQNAGSPAPFVPESSGLAIISLALIGTASVLYILLMVSQFSIGPPVGLICAGLFISYIIMACLVEFNILGNYRLPYCGVNFE